MSAPDLNFAQMQAAYNRIQGEQQLEQLKAMLVDIIKKYNVLYTAVYGVLGDQNQPGLLHRVFVAERMFDMLIGKTGVTPEEMEEYHKKWMDHMGMVQKQVTAANEAAQNQIGREA